MKVFLFVLITLLQQMHSDADSSWFTSLDLGPACITLTQLYDSTQNLCSQRNNTDLWQKVIDCHIPIDETFMRNSGEAQCPSPKYVEDPTDVSFSIQDVFFNICGMVDGNAAQIAYTAYCIVAGSWVPWVDTHYTEVKNVKANWGDDVPCNIGKCILALGLAD